MCWDSLQYDIRYMVGFLLNHTTPWSLGGVRRILKNDFPTHKIARGVIPQIPKAN